jgi:hypothetical protein
MLRSLFILSLVALMAAVGYFYEQRAQQNASPANEAVIGTVLAPQDTSAQKPVAQVTDSDAFNCDAEIGVTGPNHDIDAIGEACGEQGAGGMGLSPKPRRLVW